MKFGMGGSSQGLDRQPSPDIPRLRIRVDECARLLYFVYCLNRFDAMKVVSYSHANHALKSILDAVVQDADVAIISRDTEGDAVVMSLDYYNSLMETLHLLSTPANAAALARAIRQDQAGEAPARTLLESDGG
jgi:antitoxin YefM